MGQAQIIVVGRSGLGHGSKLPSKDRGGGDVSMPEARSGSADGSEFLRFLCLRARIGAQEPAQGGEPGGT
jgi:hypothetical protein